MSKIKLIYIKTIVEITICNLREHPHVFRMEKQQLLHGQHDALPVQQPGDRKRGRLEQVRSSLGEVSQVFTGKTITIVQNCTHITVVRCSCKYRLNKIAVSGVLHFISRSKFLDPTLKNFLGEIAEYSKTELRKLKGISWNFGNCRVTYRACHLPGLSFFVSACLSGSFLSGIQLCVVPHFLIKWSVVKRYWYKWFFMQQIGNKRNSVNQSFNLFIVLDCAPLTLSIFRFVLIHETNLILQAESCFYECEPMLKHYEIKHSPGDLGDVPICGKYCDEWFEACKDDKTCTRDWLEGKLIHYRTYHWWIQGAGAQFLGENWPNNKFSLLKLAPPGNPESATGYSTISFQNFTCNLPPRCLCTITSASSIRTSPIQVNLRKY